MLKKPGLLKTCEVMRELGCVRHESREMHIGYPTELEKVIDLFGFKYRKST
jgi:hypothetical protein